MVKLDLEFNQALLQNISSKSSHPNVQPRAEIVSKHPILQALPEDLQYWIISKIRTLLEMEIRTIALSSLKERREVSKCVPFWSSPAKVEVTLASTLCYIFL